MKLCHAVLPLALLCALPVTAHAQRGFTVQDMVKLDRYGSPTLSPAALRRRRKPSTSSPPT